MASLLSGAESMHRVLLVLVLVSGVSAPLSPGHENPAATAATRSIQQAAAVPDEDRTDAVVVDTPVVALVGVRVVDGTGAPAAEDQVIVLENGRISAVGPPQSVTVPAGAQRLDLEGRTVLPGLVMLHEHMFYETDGTWHAQPVSYPVLYLAAGVTSMRTAGAMFPLWDLNVKRRIDEDGAVGPKMHLTGPYFNPPDYLQGTMGYIRLETPEDARRAVDYFAHLGFTSFKVYTDISEELLAAVIEAAHSHGLTVAGHLARVSCGRAAVLGIDTIEHSFASCTADLGEDWGIDSALSPTDPRVQELIRVLVDNEVVLVPPAFDMDHQPTDEELELLHPTSREVYLRKALERARYYPGDRGRQGIRELERAFAAAGGRLGLGGDAFSEQHFPGTAIHDQLENLVEAGWTPIEVIRLATSSGAEILGVSESTGRIVNGLAADLIVIDGDPSVDIGDLSNIELVFKDGIGYDAATLRASVKGMVGWQ